jgi:iron complex transport system substrate-binding protein
MRLTTKVTIFLIVSAFLASFLGACTSTSKRPAPVVQSEPAFPLNVTDQMDRQVRIEKIPERIVSLSPSNTEIVYALGLEENLVGVTEFCDYPEAAKDKPKVGGFSTVDIEKVVGSESDLILAASIHKEEVIPRLEGLGLTVLALTPKTFDEVPDAITLVGKCTGEQEEAAQLVAGMGNRIRAITDKTENLKSDERPRVFYIIWHDPLKTVGSDTLIHELIELAGGTNIAQSLSEEYPAMSLEAVIMSNPQVIIAGSGMGEGASLPYEFALTEERLKDLDARVNGQLYEIDTDLVGRPGPRMVDGLEQLAKMIHPEMFGSIE